MAVIVTLTLLTSQHYLPQGEIMARNATFIIISMPQIFNVFNMRSLRKSIFDIGIFSNKWVNFAFIGAIILQFLVVKIPFLRDLMGFEDLPILDFVVMMLISTVIVGAGEIYKYLKFKKTFFKMNVLYEIMNITETRYKQEDMRITPDSGIPVKIRHLGGKGHEVRIGK